MATELTEQVNVNVYTNAVAMLRGRTSKKVGNNTYARLTDSGAVAIRLHDTDIVGVSAEGDIVLNSGGWRTHTTKDRINSALAGLFGSRYGVPFSVYQEKSIWYVVRRIPGIMWRESPRYKFADGLTIRADLSIDGAGADDDADKILLRRIKRYCAAYVAALLAGEIAAPGLGDCLYCQFRGVDSGVPLGEMIGNSEHLESHITESYFVPSLLARAIELYPVSQVALWCLSDLWGGTSHGAVGTFGDTVRRQFVSSLQRYMRHCFGLA